MRQRSCPVLARRWHLPNPQHLTPAVPRRTVRQLGKKSFWLGPIGNPFLSISGFRGTGRTNRLLTCRCHGSFWVHPINSAFNAVSTCPFRIGVAGAYLVLVSVVSTRYVTPLLTLTDTQNTNFPLGTYPDGVSGLVVYWFDLFSMNASLGCAFDDRKTSDQSGNLT